MSLANLKATTKYQEAIQATEDLESPAVGFAKTSDYKGGLAVQVNAVIKQNNTLLYLATKKSQKLVLEYELLFEECIGLLKRLQWLVSFLDIQLLPLNMQDSSGDEFLNFCEEGVQPSGSSD
ncbi:hypothetical protein Tco_0887538 [Tanacetum coccineum]